MTMPAIRYLEREEIDTVKWDRCVAGAPNGWLYARAFYLDGLGHWHALVHGDYEHIMPLPVRRKYGIHYIYIPPFTGQLGIIGRKPVTQTLTDEFIRRIPRSFSLAEVLLNEGNQAPSLPGIHTVQRTNLILPLKDDYASIYRHYSKDAQKNLRKTAGMHLEPCFDIAMETVIGMYKDAYGKKNRDLSSASYDRMATLGDQCMRNGSGFTMGIRNGEGALLAAAFFGMDEKRIYYILGAPGGKDKGPNAVHNLIDEVIKKYAGTGITFDFEGSDIPSVAAFYRKFSPQVMRYDFVRVIRSPFLRLFFRLR